MANEDYTALKVYQDKNDLEGAERDGCLIRVPGSLREALDDFEASGLAREVCGEGLWQRLCETKRREWDRFAKAVTDWERNTYLPVL